MLHKIKCFLGFHKYSNIQYFHALGRGFRYCDTCKHPEGLTYIIPMDVSDAHRKAKQ